MTRAERYAQALQSLIIRDEAQRFVPMTFLPSQRILWAAVRRALEEGRPLWFVVLKGRQVYSTSFWAAVTFLRTVERPGTHSLVVAHELATADDILERMKVFYEHLPLPPMDPPRRHLLVFPFPEGKSHIRIASAHRLGKGRGTNLSCVVGSEVAYWPNPEILVGLRQAVPSHVTDTLWVLESTANGMVGVGQAFYEEWKAAVDGRSELTPIFVPWFVLDKFRRDPAVAPDEMDSEEKLLLESFGADGLDGRALAWRRFAIQSLCHGSVELFDQEYPSTPEHAFISTGLPAFERRAVLQQQKTIQPPRMVGEMRQDRFVRATRGSLLVWREPEDGHQYVIGVDTSEGLKGGDYACAQVLDMGTLEQVAVLHGAITPWELAGQVAQLGQWYNRALVAVEVQGSGISVQDYLIRLFQYPNLHLWRGRSDTIRGGTPRLYGWVTNVHTRPLLLDAGRRAINTGLIVLHDRSTLDEISKFSRTDVGRYEASFGHDDRVLALLIALRSREENYQGGGATLSAPLGEPTLPPAVAAVEEWTGVRRRAAVAAAKRRAEAGIRSWMAM